MIVVYHANCADGLAAALVVKRALEFKVPVIEFMPLEYTVPETLPECLPGDEFIVVDFSFKGQSLVEHFKQAKSVKVFDHHAGAIDKLKTYFSNHPQPSNVELFLDTGYSGVGLAWNYFYPGVPMPPLFKYVQDYDLYRFEHAETRAYMESLSIVPMTLEDYDRFEGEDVADIVNAGQLLLRKREADVNYHINHNLALGCLTWCEEYTVPIVNAPRYLRDSLGEVLAESYPFAVIYYDQGEQRHFSLRAKKGSPVNVAEIAQRYGGNGHPSAAGFKAGIWDTAFRVTPSDDVGFVE